MQLLRLNLIMAAMALLLVRCGSLTTQSQSKDYGALSSQLKKDMSEQEASAAIGSSPDKIDLVTCGDETASPWKCKTWIYKGGFEKKNLRVIFYQPKGGDWRVDEWQVY
jgi:hypothetical protein